MPANDKHMCFKAPMNENVKVWRYMDLAKFLSLISEKSLYFCRIDQLDDPYEGAISNANISLRPVVYKDVDSIELSKKLTSINLQMRNNTYVNCWHMNNYESEAMWKIFGKIDEAIAIQSTYKELKENLSNEVYIGMIKYIDYEEDWLPENNLLHTCMHKRKAFEHEKEVRALINNIDNVVKGTVATNNGILIPINLENVIKNIYISPTAQIWFAELVKGIIQKYEIKIPVITSNLAKAPVF